MNIDNLCIECRTKEAVNSKQQLRLGGFHGYFCKLLGVNMARFSYDLGVRGEDGLGIAELSIRSSHTMQFVKSLLISHSSSWCPGPRLVRPRGMLVKYR